MTERTIRSTKEITRKTDFSPKREMTEDPNILNLLCGIGNHEMKALLTILMARNPKKIFGSVNFHDDLLDVLKSKKSFSKHVFWDAPSQFCSFSLVPSGIVEIIPSPTMRRGDDEYRLTDYGQDIGFGFAGHLLDLSLRYDFSLHDLFGRTHQFYNKELQNHESIPQYTRLKLLRALIQKDLPITTKEIAEEIGFSRPEDLGNRHIKELAKAGIVTYNYFESEDDTPTSEHRLTVKGVKLEKLPKELECPGYRTLSQHVFEIAYLNEFQGDADWLTRERIAEILIAKDPYFGTLKKNPFLGKIGAILAHFERQGLVDTIKRDVPNIEVDLFSTQFNAISELLNILDRFSNRDRDFIEEGKEKALQIINNPKKVKLIMGKSSRDKKIPLVYTGISKTYSAWSELGHRISLNALKKHRLLDAHKSRQPHQLERMVFDAIYQNEFNGDADWLTIDRTADIILEKVIYEGDKNDIRDALMLRIRDIYAQFEKQGLIEVWNPPKDAKSQITNVADDDPHEEDLMGI